MSYTKEHLIKNATLSQPDRQIINRCRGTQNRLGFAYQLIFVRLYNRFPNRAKDNRLSEIEPELIDYIKLQLNIKSERISEYGIRQKTVYEHREQIRQYEGLRTFNDNPLKGFEQFIFEQSCRMEQTHALLSVAKDFLRLNRILQPADSTLRRVILGQREKARTFIFEKINRQLNPSLKEKLDELLKTSGKAYSVLHALKSSPGRASARAVLKITEKLELLESTGVLEVDLKWLSNNLQRSMNRYIRRADVARIRKLADKKRYAMLVCFIKQHYRDMTDDLVRTYDKVMNQMYNRTQKAVDHHHRKQRKIVRNSLKSFQVLAHAVLNESIENPVLRNAIFEKITKSDLEQQYVEVNQYLDGKHQNTFSLLVHTRFSHLRKFAPQLLKHLKIQKENTDSESSIMEAVELLRQMNDSGKRKLESAAPVDFMTKSMQDLVFDKQGNLHKPSWECALLTAVRDGIKSGNIAVQNSKRYGQLDNFFIPEKQWKAGRDSFFQKAGLPKQGKHAVEILTKKLNAAFDRFLNQLPENPYVRVDNTGWLLSKDEAENLPEKQQLLLKQLHRHLAQNMRIIKLPQLLIEVDNELHFSKFFMKADSVKRTTAEQVRAVMAAIMAHGCNIGTYTMSHLIQGVSYRRIKNISDWLLTQQTQRSALAVLVNAISDLNISKHWGQGNTSSSDGQRFRWKQKVLQQTYSSRFNDFALEFYTFIADNFAPFYNLPTECTDRDAPYVLDGLLYNESDLQIEEHYTDTHGYTEINFAAFAMLGKRFSPRIKGLHHQKIYRIDTQKDYKELNVLVANSKNTIDTKCIIEQWDKMGHFYYSLQSGYTTASTALKRLNGFTGKNRFYKANRELGRIFKTIHILNYMSDKSMRSRITKGLLKSEQLHQLARDLKFAKRGNINARDWSEQRNSGSCLTLIMACIIYWQAKEIHRVLLECPADFEVNLDLIKHIRPITWDNVILYGEYVIEDDWIILEA